MFRFFGSTMAIKLSRVMGFAVDIPLPSLLLEPLIKAYSFGVGVNLDDVLEPEEGYGCFGDFFARKLKPGVRPVANDATSFVSPCDGELVGVGQISSIGRHSFSVKNSSYDVGQILGVSDEEGAVFAGGGQMVIYLHPRDYHRVHIPLNAALTRVRHIPGKRFPVAPWSEKRVLGIYGKNERMVFEIDLPGGGKLALVMVAAFGVGNIETSYKVGNSNDSVSTNYLDPAVTMQSGDELGVFRLGSTVVMLWTKDSLEIDDTLRSGQVFLGQNFGATTPGEG